MRPTIAGRLRPAGPGRHGAGTALLFTVRRRRLESRSRAAWPGTSMKLGGPPRRRASPRSDSFRPRQSQDRSWEISEWRGWDSWRSRFLWRSAMENRRSLLRRWRGRWTVISMRRLQSAASRRLRLQTTRSGCAASAWTSAVSFRPRTKCARSSRTTPRTAATARSTSTWKIRASPARNHVSGAVTCWPRAASGRNGWNAGCDRGSSTSCAKAVASTTSPAP